MIVSLRGHVKILGKFINEGKASIAVDDRGLTVLLSKAVPDELGMFMTLLIDKVRLRFLLLFQLPRKIH